MIRKFKKNNGFTLIETLVSVVVFVIIIAVMVSFSYTLQTTRLRQQMILEVNDQGTRILRVITGAIRSANAVNVPTAGDDSPALSLSVINSTTSPIVFSITDETLFMTEASRTLPLTNNKVKASNLIFSNQSRSATPGVVGIRFTLRNSASSTRVEQQYAVDFYGTASIR